MQALLEGVEPTAEQSQVIICGLLDLARVDGLHDAERALIANFAGTEDLASFEATPFDLPAAASVLKAGGKDVIESFFSSAYLLIYADGQHTEAERTRVAEYAVALDIDPAQLESLHLKARLYLLHSLASVAWSKDAVIGIGASMGLSADQISAALEN